MIHFKSATVFIAALCCLSLISLTNSVLIQPNLSEYKAQIEKHLKNPVANELHDLYYKTVNLVEHGKESVEKIASKDTVCAFLKKVGFKPAVESGHGSEFIYLYKAFGCPEADLKEEHKDLLRLASKGDKLEDIENAIDVQTAHKSFGATEVQEACSKAAELIKDDGTAKSAKRGTEANYSNTARVLDVLRKCKELNVLDNKVVTKLDKVYRNVLDNAKSVGRDAKAFVEEDVFGTTSKILHSIQKLSPTSLKGHDLSSFVSYLKSHKDALTTPERHHWFRKASESVKDVPVVELASNVLTRGKDLILKAKLNNLAGEELKNTTGLKLKGNVYGGAGDKQSSAVGNELNFEKKADGIWEAKLNEKDLKDNNYQLRMIVSQGSNSYNYVEDLSVRAALKPKSVRFQVTKSVDRSDSPLENVVEVGETSKTTLTANQGNYIHVEIKVDSDAPKTGLVAARLVNKQYRFITGTVPAKFNYNTYRIVIDLGDPDHIQPYNGQYDLELLISGGDVETPVRWTLAKVDVTFVKPAESAPVRDADVTPLPEIHHKFPEPRRKPLSLITVAFSLVAIVAVLGFLAVLLRLGVNLDNLPTDVVGAVSSLGLLGAIGAILGAIVLFWLKINLPQVLILLCLLAVPTVIIGNSALKSLARNK